MDIQTLFYFRDIASGKTYFDVAEENHISQSSLSKAIMRLEDELNAPLFDRKKRTVTLTPAGRCLYDMVDQIAPIIRSTRQKIASMSAVQNVRIAIVPNVDYMNLDMRIPSSPFYRDNPQINIELVSDTYLDECIELLRRDEVDILITKVFRITRDYCDYEEIADDPMYVVLRNDHPFADRPVIDFADLYHEHVVIHSPVIRRALQECCNHIGRDMLPDLDFIQAKPGRMSRLSILNRVSVGHGITFYFRNDLRPLTMRNLLYIPLTNVPSLPVCLARRKGRALQSAQLQCWDYLREELKNPDW